MATRGQLPAFSSFPPRLPPEGVSSLATASPTANFQTEPGPIRIEDFGTEEGGRPYNYSKSESFANRFSRSFDFRGTRGILDPVGVSTIPARPQRWATCEVKAILESNCSTVLVNHVR